MSNEKASASNSSSIEREAEKRRARDEVLLNQVNEILAGKTIFADIVIEDLQKRSLSQASDMNQEGEFSKLSDPDVIERLAEAEIRNCLTRAELVASRGGDRLDVLLWLDEAEKRMEEHQSSGRLTENQVNEFKSELTEFKDNSRPDK